MSFDDWDQVNDVEKWEMTEDEISSIEKEVNILLKRINKLLK
jgi:hypothetical protein